MPRRVLGSGALLVSLLVASHARANDAHVVHERDRDDAAAGQLAAALAGATIHEHATLPESARELVELSRSLGNEALAVVLDGRRGTIHVARATDGLVVSRHLGTEAFAGSPYAVGIVAEELVRLTRDAPSLTEAASVERPGANEITTSDTTRTTPDTAPPAPPLFTPTAELAAGAAFGLRGGPSVFGAHLAAGAAWLPDGWLVSAEGLVAIHAEHALGVTAPAIGEGELRYRRIDVALRASFGRIDSNGTIAAQASLGLALTRVELADDGGNVRAEHEGSHPWLGLGVALRRPIGFGVTVGLYLGLDWALSPERYLVHGAPVFEESRLRARSAVAIGWSNYP